MARYCFYCGRELTTGEKCNCRSNKSSSSWSYASQGAASGASASGSAASGSAAGQKTGRHSAPRQKAGQARTPRGNIFSRFFQSINPFAAGSSGSSGSSGSKTRTTYQKARPASAPRKPLTAQDALLALRRFGLFLTRPADSVRSAAQSGSRRFVLVIMILQGIAGGLFLLSATSRPLVRELLTLSNFTASGSLTTANSIFLFVQGFGVAVVAALLLSLLYHLALKYMFRHPVPFMDLLASLSPACLYFSLFMLAGLSAVQSSVFSALMLLAAGFAVSAIVQFLAVGSLSGFEDNRSFMAVTIVLLVYSSVLSLIFNLSLPLLQVLLEQSSVI